MPPVASSSLPKRNTAPVWSVTVRAAGSMAVTRRPSTKSTRAWSVPRQMESSGSPFQRALERGGRL